MRTDKDLAMKAAMVFWESRGLNKFADNASNLSDNDICEDLTEIVNGPGLAGLKERTEFYQNLKKSL